MEYEKDPNRKPYKSVLSNALWSIRGMVKDAPVSLLLMLLELPLAVFLAWSQVRLPALAVGKVTAGADLRDAAMAVGVMMLAMLVATVIRDICGAALGVKLQFYRFSRGRELIRKSMTGFFQTYEKKETRDMYGRAEKATWMWNGVQPLSDAPRFALTLTENLLCCALFGSVISFVNPWLTVLITLAPAVNILAERAYRKWEYGTRASRADNERKLDYILSKPAEFASYKDIRVYGMAGWFREVCRDLLKTDLSWAEKMNIRQFLSRLANLLMILIRDGAAYALLIARALRGEVTVEQFVLYFAAISSFADYVGNIITGWNNLGNGSLFLSDFREYLDLPDDMPDGELNADVFLNRTPEIVFDHVSFRYDGAEQDTIHDLCLTMAPGEKVALVGLNGAGKTTLVKLLCGLYAPTSGEIRIDGVPIRDFRREEYYKLLSPVFQDVRTGPFSLAETVTCRLDGSGDIARAENCLRLAGLGDKPDSLPRGMDTVLDRQISKDGTELSGGEKQKLMLARAIYKEAPILILDEPTAALDPIAENEIYLQYNAMTAGKTSLFISHRLASTQFCDRILFLDHGRIAEQGTHAQLIALKGEYSRLYEIQSCWYRDDCEGGEES